MTTIVATEVTCAVCGAANRVEVLVSSNTFGSSDLDTRPPEMLRSALHTGVARCAHCGHCAADLAHAVPGAADGVRDDDYRALLADDTLPAKAREFLCRARLESAAGRLADAFWATISAAWTADDANDAAAADRCRSLAVAALRLARAAGRPVSDQPGIDAVIEVDLLRRRGEFAGAEACIRRALDRPLPEVIGQVLRLQRDLVAEHDRSAHRVAEALGGDG
jgi:hypothetical protein